MLTRLGEDKLLRTYELSKNNTLKKTDDLQIVISRHPYDIIGMSTNRGWTTCHDLNDKRYNGNHLHNIANNLRGGCLIAYLIRKNDRNIKDPISRCLILRNGFGGLRPDRHIYGTYIDEFKYFLDRWCNEITQKMK